MRKSITRLTQNWSLKRARTTYLGFCIHAVLCEMLPRDVILPSWTFSSLLCNNPVSPVIGRPVATHSSSTAWLLRHTNTHHTPKHSLTHNSRWLCSALTQESHATRLSTAYTHSIIDTCVCAPHRRHLFAGVASGIEGLGQCQRQPTEGGKHTWILQI